MDDTKQPYDYKQDPYFKEEPGLQKPSEGYDNIGGSMVGALIDPVEIVSNAATGGMLGFAKGGLKQAGKEAVDWGLAGIPSLAKGVAGLGKGVFRGLSAKNIEQAIPVEKAAPVASAVQETIAPVALSAEQKLLEALKGAKVSRKELAVMQHAKRQEQNAMLGGIYSKSTGEVTAKVARGSMKGKLVDKAPDFESLRPKLEQTDIDELVMKIHQSDKITNFDKLGADEGLRKILSGEIPQPAEMGKLKSVFGEELVKDVLIHRPWRSKVLDIITTGANMPRAIMASFDASAPLRQGLIMTVSHPKLASKAFAESWKQTFNPKRYAEWLDSVRSHPLYDLMEESKLYIADPERQASALWGKEEKFMTQTTISFNALKEKMPEVGKVVERLVNMGLAPVRASERNYTTYLNKLRVDSFAQLADNFIKSGKTPETDPELFKHLANFINSATGRGSMEGWQRSAQALNTIFFSPRLIKARVDMLKYIAPGNGIPPEVRKEALKDIGITVGACLSFVGLLKVAGADVETDPKSSDWMKAKIGNVRIDPWGGFQQYGKLYARSFNWNELKKGSVDNLFEGKMKTSSGEVKKTTALDEVSRFLRYKVAPTPSYIAELLGNKKLMGGDVDFFPEEKMFPIVLQDIKEIAQENPNLLFAAGPLAFFGMNVQSYKPKTQFH